MRKPFLIVPLLLWCAVGAGCVSNQTTETLKSTFDAGVAAYDAGDYATAYKLWSSIDDDDVAAMRNVGMLERKGLGTAKNPKAAEEMFARAAEAGLPTAQADLADMLLKGEAGPPDPVHAVPLLETAAAANHPVAQYELAQLYESGSVVPKDMKKARRLYAAAASHGMAEAQKRLKELGPDTDAPPGIQASVPPGPGSTQNP